MATTVCGNRGCNKKGCHLCSACNAIAYCSKDCQKEDWKKHKKKCAACRSRDDSTKIVSADDAKKNFIPGRFCIIETKIGNQISMGYEATKISPEKRREFEEAVAAVEAYGVIPPPLEESSEATVMISICPFNIPFFLLMWLAEATYGENADPSILRVQEMATNLTGGASNMLHLLIQPCGQPLTPNLNCKCRGVEDLYTALEYLTTRYLLDSGVQSIAPRWAPITLTELLKLLGRFCQMENAILDRVWKTRTRIQREKTWDTCEEELVALKNQVELTDMFKASTELFELLVELTRRASFDAEGKLSVRSIRSVLALQQPIEVVSVDGDKVYEYVEEALQVAAGAEGRLVYSVVTPDGAEWLAAPEEEESLEPLYTSGGGGNLVELAEPAFKRSKDAPLEALPTLRRSGEIITENISRKSHGYLPVRNIIARIRSTLMPLGPSSNNDGGKEPTDEPYLDNLVVEEIGRLRKAAEMNAHLIMSRVLRGDLQTKNEDFADATVAALQEEVREAAALCVYARRLRISANVYEWQSGLGL